MDRNKKKSVFRKLSILFISVLLIISPLTSFEQVVSADNKLEDERFRYEIENGVAKVVRDLRTSNNIEIPDYVDNYPVRIIGEDLFHWLKNHNRERVSPYPMKKVKLPSGVTRIEGFAFYFNEIEEMFIPESVTYIGEAAFGSNQLTEIEIPNAVAELGAGAFVGNWLHTVTLPDKLTEIPNRLFDNNSLSEIHFPSDIKKIGDAAFRWNQFEQITLHENINEIGNYAFFENNLMEVKILGDVRVLEENVFANNEITQIDLPRNLEEMEWSALADNNLSAITFPNTLKTIGELALKSNNLTTITLPDGLETIEREAFFENSLTEVVLPESVESVGNLAFSYNPITDVYINNPQMKIGGSAFHDHIKEPKEVTIHGYRGSTAEAYARENGHPFRDLTGEAWDWKDNSDGTVTITQYDSDVMDVIIPTELDGKKVTKIGDKVLQGKGITSIDIPDTVTEIGVHAFADNALTSIRIHENMRKIGDNAFANNNITDAAFYYQYMNIGDDILAGNQANPSDLKVQGPFHSRIKDYALDYGYSFESIKDLVFVWEVNEFDRVVIRDYLAEDSEVIIPDEIDGKIVAEIGGQSFMDKGITKVTMPDTITRIGGSAFSGNHLTEVTMPENLSVIREYAFFDNELTEVELPFATRQIMQSAFENNKLEKVTIHSTTPTFGTNQVESDPFVGNTNDLVIYGGAFSWTKSFAKDFGYTFRVISDFDYDVTTDDEVIINGYTGTDEHVIIPEQIDGKDVITIDSEAFLNKGIKSLDIPAQVKKVKERAFKDNDIQNVFVRGEDTDFETDVFAGNQTDASKLQFYAPDTSKAYDYAITNGFTVDELPPFTWQYDEIDGNVRIIDYTGTDTEVTIPNELNGIPVTWLAYGSFKGKNLTKVTLPESVEIIDEESFMDNNLVKVEIPKSVTEMGNAAFANNNLEEVIVHSKQANFGFGVFMGNGSTPADLIIYGEEGSTAETYAKSNHNNHTFKDITTTIQSIKEPSDKYVTQGTSLEDVHLPESIEATFKDGKKRNVEVKWNTDEVGYDGEKIGTYTFVGTLQDGENANQFQPNIKVRMYKKETVSLVQETSVVPETIYEIKDKKTSVIVPEDTPEGTKLEIEEFTADPGTPAVPGDSDEGKSVKIKVAGDAYKFTFKYPEGKDEPKGPFVLTLEYDENADPDQIAIYYLNENTNMWERRGGQVDTKNRVITLLIPHFSTYAVFEEAIDELDEPTKVDFERLEDLYNEHKNKTADAYTTESWSVFEQALQYSEVLLSDRDNAEQDAVNSAVQSLEEAIDGLEPAKEEPTKVNFERLENLYNEHKDKQNSNYPEENWNKFQQALTNAKELLEADKDKVSQIKVDTALEALQDAFEALAEDEEDDDPKETRSIEIKPGEETEVNAGDTVNIQLEGTNTTITMPEDLPSGVRIKVKDARDSEEAKRAAPLVIAGDVFDVIIYGLNDGDIKKPFILTMGYDNETYSKDEVTIYYYDESKKDWKKQEIAVVDAVAGTITLEVPHFSMYGVFADKDDTELKQKDIKVTIEDDKTDTKDDQEASEDEEGKELPKTATNIFNLIMLGAILFIVGGVSLIFLHRKVS